jgi:hypothetical protein
MNKTLLLSLFCLCIAVAWRLAFAQTAASIDVEKPLDKKPGQILVRGGVSGIWLKVERINKNDPAPSGEGGFDPSVTYLVSDFRPVVRPLKDGKWLIQFDCSICEGLP